MWYFSNSIQQFEIRAMIKTIKKIDVDILVKSYLELRASLLVSAAAAGVKRASILRQLLQNTKQEEYKVYWQQLATPKIALMYISQSLCYNEI